MVHLVICVHFQSDDKDGSHTIRSAVPENLMLYANIMAQCLTRTGVIANGSFTLQEEEFSTFLAPVTLTR